MPCEGDDLRRLRVQLLRRDAEAIGRRLGYDPLGLPSLGELAECPVSPGEQARLCSEYGRLLQEARSARGRG